MPAETPYSVTDRETLYEQLATIQEQGYSQNVQEVLEEFSNISVAVTHPNGRVFRALSIDWPTYFYEDGIDDDIIENLFETVEAIESDIAAQQT